MVKEIEELIKIVGKGNLLEAAFIYLGSFQHADLQRHMDHRNHNGLSEFINKKEQEPLDKYFNLKFSLQGLFLIYAQAYNVLIENAQLNTQEVIDTIYAAIESEKTSTVYNVLGNLPREIVDQAGLTEDQKKLKLLNILANPKGEALFNNNNDFEKQVLNNVKKLLRINYANEFDKEFSLCKEVINHYYSIHNIKVDKDVALLFFMGSDYEKLSPSNKTVKREVLEICKNQLIGSYIIFLANKLGKIRLSSRDGTIKYTIDHEDVDQQKALLKGYDDLIYPINIKNTLEQLLKNQSSDEFEQLVTSPENIYYSVQQEENECRPSFAIGKKNHKNTFCKLALGMFVLSVGLYVADYFFMEQKLLNSIKNVLPQDNLTNLIVGAVLTIVIVYALFQLSQKPPLSTVNKMTNENLGPLHAKQA
ncbi:hypothetical protein EUZ93_05350 [Wolbachia pipientis]|nr:hypothetical protein [Wolbachia pipientis]